MANFLNAVGERYHDFVLTKIVPISELQCTLRELVHEPTGATVMHLENSDPENLFCLSFRTLPKSSNGAPHILEHTVLCGSKKFPIKDPFFSMTRRSLNTFMNALTGSDFTCYPASSQVEKDFYNLLDVYLDAVFHPHLKRVSFLQEGHRLEFVGDVLENKGVVFNEMKGSLASPDSRLWHAILEYLVPDLPYSYNSGGEPKEIPKLTYEELVDFHKTYYHPSHCLFFFYGNLPLQKHLDFLIAEGVLNVKKAQDLPPVTYQKRFQHPVHKEIPYPIEKSGDLSKECIIAFSWLTTPLTLQEDVLTLSVVDSILMDTDASPLKRELLASGLCIQADSFYDPEMSEIPYVIVSRGCLKESAEPLEKVIKTALEKICKEGISADLIESALHQIEFSRSEIVGDHSPFGLTLFMRSGLAKQHGCPPENSLMIHSIFDRLRLRLKDPNYLSDFIEKYFLKNPHQVRITLFPDTELASKEVLEEKKELQKIEKSLSDEEKKRLIAQASDLQRYQAETANQNLNVLPQVGLEDVPILCRDFLLKEEMVGDLRVFHHECFTNQIIYADLVFDLPDIAEPDLPYVHFMTSIMSEVGVGNRDFATNLEYIHAHLGGIGASCNLHVQVQNPEWMRPSLIIRGKALKRKGDKLFSLLKEMATSVRFDEEARIEDLILQTHNSLQQRLQRSAMRYVIQEALSGFSTPSYIGEKWHGISYVKTIEKLATHMKEELGTTLAKLHQLKELLLTKSPHLVISCDKESYASLRKEQFYGLKDLPVKEQKPWVGLYPPPLVASHARPIAAPVAFTTRAFKTVSGLHPHAAALSAAALLFDHKVLHPKIREQGGAYGSGATYSTILGQFYFHSYRDPHIKSTLQAFSDSIVEIAENKFTKSDVQEAKLGIIQQLDAPIAPGSRASIAYSWWREGKTREIRQHFRDKILALTPQEIVQGVEKELLPKKDLGVIITFAGKELLEKEKLNLPIVPI